MQDAIAGISLLSFKVVLFDLDGTLISSYMENTDKSFDRWEVLPNRLEVLYLLKRYGNSIKVVSNQGGVAFGLATPAEVEAKISKVAQLLGYAHCTLHDGGPEKELDVPGAGAGEVETYVAYDHPKASIPQYRGDTRRKPNAAMILEAMRGMEKEDVIFVGDRPEDEQAAAAAGVRFCWAQDFFAVV